MKRTALIAPLSIVVLAFGASSAQAVIIGSPSQSSAQSAQTNQGIDQNAGGGITIGPTVQAAGNSSTTGMANVQAVVGGGVLIGSPAQASAQAAQTDQAINQDTGPGVQIGPVFQGGANANAIGLANFQLII